MDPSAVLDLVLGNLGSLVILCAVLYALVWGGQLIVGKTHAKARDGRAAAEREAEGYAEMLRAKDTRITKLSVALARAEEGLKMRLDQIERKTDEQTGLLDEIRNNLEDNPGEGA